MGDSPHTFPQPDLSLLPGASCDGAIASDCWPEGLRCHLVLHSALEGEAAAVFAVQWIAFTQMHTCGTGVSCRRCWSGRAGLLCDNCRANLLGSGGMTEDGEQLKLFLVVTSCSPPQAPLSPRPGSDRAAEARRLFRSQKTTGTPAAGAAEHTCGRLEERRGRGGRGPVALRGCPGAALT